MAYDDLNNIHNPSTGGLAPAAWGDQVRDNFEFLARVPACSVFHSVAVSIASSVSASFFACDSEEFDNASMHSTVTNNSRITVPVDGNYRVSGTVQYSANTNGVRSLAFRVNGTTLYGNNQVGSSGATNSTVLTGSRTFTMTAGQYVEIGGWQNSGGGLNMTVLDFCVELISIA